MHTVQPITGAIHASHSTNCLLRIGTHMYSEQRLNLCTLYIQIMVFVYICYRTLQTHYILYVVLYMNDIIRLIILKLYNA